MVVVCIRRRNQKAKFAAKGRKEGRKGGSKEGRKEGRKQGRKEGRKLVCVSDQETLVSCERLGLSRSEGD